MVSAADKINGAAAAVKVYRIVLGLLKNEDKITEVQYQAALAEPCLLYTSAKSQFLTLANTKQRQFMKAQSWFNRAHVEQSKQAPGQLERKIRQEKSHLDVYKRQWKATFSWKPCANSPWKWAVTTSASFTSPCSPCLLYTSSRSG